MRRERCDQSLGATRDNTASYPETGLIAAMAPPTGRKQLMTQAGKYPERRCLLPVLSICLFAAGAIAAELDTAKIDELTGLKGKMNQQEGVYKITFPRNDVTVAVDGWQLPPFMGLGTWAAFTKAGDAEAMVMGDTVLFEDEVNPVLSVALDNGLAVTALHNHFFFDHPKVYFMHISGSGTVVQLASAVRKMYDKVKEVRGTDPKPKETFAKTVLPTKSSITAAPLNGVFGVQADTNNGMAKYVIGRTSAMHGVQLGKEIGVNTWAAFAGSDSDAVVDGDFAMSEDELQPVLRSLRKGGINIVGIHNHMIDESPRIMFLHYWGRGTAVDLAKAVKAALDLTHTAQTGDS
jgi:Domain of Unknown Function (DUF1259)